MTGAGLMERRHAQGRSRRGPARRSGLHNRAVQYGGGGDRLSNNAARSQSHGKGPGTADQCARYARDRVSSFGVRAGILALALTFLPRRLADRGRACLATAEPRRGRAHHAAQSGSRVDSSEDCPAKQLKRHTKIKLTGAPRRTRTADPLITNQMLYQLSYRGAVHPLRRDADSIKSRRASGLPRRRQAGTPSGSSATRSRVLRVVFHLGVHQTDEDRLVRSVLKNRGVLARQQISVPGPGRYRVVLRDVVNRLRGEPATAEAEELLIEAVADTDAPSTLFLSNASFLCLPERALDDGRLYARAFKAQWLRQVFPRHDCTFAVAIRDPASFVPALFAARRNRELGFERFLGGLDPETLRWSDMIATIREHCPASEIIVWCNEDTPLLWGAIMRAVTGAAPDIALDGMLDIALRIVSPEGAAAIADHFGRPPHYDGPEFRLALARLIETHGRADAIAEEIDLPGWDGALMARLSAAYDADVARIADMPGVRFIAP